MYRLIKNGLVREVSTLDAAHSLEREGYAMADMECPSVQVDEAGARYILEDNLADLTVEQLRGLCTDRKIDAPKESKKADLIRLIIDHDLGQ